ncbi:GNAT family N-acetyltransferase [Paenibacillus thermoaerophilus]|uniref:GNAT family N-acetyltransferase n=1 Tax=Paenibacillus thermoaerophilus TaxID=1215385 RepID=A0ABW2UX44_9BACL|nr:GNAT family N-acetyltransferase [Paenibacillus thermoaerophilus]TMV17340.1 GNAT family N-acetyltransferase [Paenibacillus thermoaerophilus]
MDVHIRSYTVEDYEQLLDVQREAFPPPFPEELWWRRDQIEAHVRAFPQGAMAAVRSDGTIIGSATSLIIQYDGKPHTWEEVSDRGYIEGTHNPNGDSLYGIDVCVRPSARGMGVAGLLYEARKRLVTELGLKRFVAGCRIPGYGAHAGRLSAEEYVQAVVRGELKDQVLSFMLKQGLKPLQVLPNYLEDEDSRDYAVLVEWRNPNLPEGEGERKTE